MIEKREILAIAEQTSLTPHVVEKDYVLGWMLAGIYSREELADSWVFKGGTCLKKCFFETYRFSEDLDFTLRDPSPLNENFLKRIFKEVGEWIYVEHGRWTRGIRIEDETGNEIIIRMVETKSIMLQADEKPEDLLSGDHATPRHGSSYDPSMFVNPSY